MTPTLTQMQTWFGEFNATVFNNELPTVKLSFNNARCQLGQFYWGRGRGIGIKLSLFWDRSEEQYRNGLLHEMCHLYCYHKGWIHEGHGEHWKRIAAYATKKTGLKIQRCTDITGWKVSSGNEGKMQAVQEKKKAPAILVDFDYGTYHFIVKTTRKVLQSSKSSIAKSCRVFISDAPLFTRWQTSRSIHRGYRYQNDRYDKEIKPLLDKAIEVEDLRKLFRGDYDSITRRAQ